MTSDTIKSKTDQNLVKEAFQNSFYTISEAQNISGFNASQLLEFGAHSELAFLVQVPDGWIIRLCDKVTARAWDPAITTPSMLVIEPEICWQIFHYGNGEQMDFRIGFQYEDRKNEFQVRYPFSTTRNVPVENAVWGFMTDGYRISIKTTIENLFVRVENFKLFLNKKRIPLSDNQDRSMHDWIDHPTTKSIATTLKTLGHNVNSNHNIEDTILRSGKDVNQAFDDSPSTIANGQDKPKLHPSLQNFDSLPDSAFVNIKVVCGLFDCSEATVYRRVKAGLIPEPRKFSTHDSRWSVGDLRKSLKD